MDNAPSISVVIPTYNQPIFLLKTLASVFAQTFTDFEVVVINDGSTDDTLEQLKPLQDQHKSRLRIISQENQGIGAARNRAIDEARGHYVATLDHDDLWMPNKLETQIQYMAARPSCAACSVPWAFSNKPSVCAFNLQESRNSDGIVPRPVDLFARGQAIVMTSSLMFRREAAAGLRYDPHRGSLEDLAFLILLAARGDFAVAGDEILMVYRLHAGNASSATLRYYHGTLSLRRLNSAGGFRTLAPQQMVDLRGYLAFLGRFASIQLLLGGFKKEAAVLYGEEFRHQLRLGEFRYLLLFPPLWAMPGTLLRRIGPWAHKAGADGQ